MWQYNWQILPVSTPETATLSLWLDISLRLLSPKKLRILRINWGIYLTCLLNILICHDYLRIYFNM